MSVPCKSQEPTGSVSSLWRNAKVAEPFRTGVSLHSHSYHSRGYLDFIPRILGRVPAADLVRRCLEQRYGGRPDKNVCWFHRHGDVVFAPNPELMQIIHSRTGKRIFPMGRGVDTVLFSPERRDRTDSTLVLGFVGRLMAVKNVRLLRGVRDALIAAGIADFRFQITGAGSEREWLEANLPQAEFTGVLSSEPLARAYTNMDIFVFPSRTDTLGNVVQEALASGVPAVVTDAGGPRFIVCHGANGLVAGSDEEFCAWVVALARDEGLRRRMGCVARRSMLQKSWDRVFEEVYEAMPVSFNPPERVPATGANPAEAFA